MKAPFTAEQFLDTIFQYNQSVFPLQILFYLIGIISIYLLFKPTSNSDKTISLILTFFWIWMGIAYHLTFFTPINKAAYFFGGIFILQGIMFSIYGFIKNKLSFHFRPDAYGITGIILILSALVLYPLLGYSFGHIYPYSPTFGLPCPTTIFTLGLLLMSDKKCPVIILVIPFIWSIIGFTAAFNFGIVEDTLLLVSGLTSFKMLIVRNRSFTHYTTA